MNEKNVYLPITFNNPSKVYFSNKKYLIYNQNKPDTNCKSIFLIKKKEDV